MKRAEEGKGSLSATAVEAFPSELSGLECSAPANFPHLGVLLSAATASLSPRPGGLVADVTVGAGRHAAELIKGLSPGGRLIACDADGDTLSETHRRLESWAEKFAVRVDFVHENFRRLDAVLDKLGLSFVDGILADLGVSSMQLDRAERGFSFRFDAPLDMRFDRTRGPTAAELLARLPEKELADMLYRRGGERRSRRIARVLAAERRREPIETTGRLADLVRRAIGGRGSGRLHPATRTFQALRSAVNDEEEALAEFLEQAPERLNPGGTLVVIAFHSGEDRPVKKRFKELSATDRFMLLEKRALQASPREREENPRSRSARLRALRRTGGASAGTK